MVKDYGEWRQQEKLDLKLYKGRRPFESAPFTIQDIAFLIARLSTGPFENKLSLIRSYYVADFSGARLCRKYRLKRTRLARLLRKVKREYSWLKRRCQSGLKDFSLKQIIILISRITFTLTQMEMRWIQAYYDTDGDWRKTCEKCNIPKTNFFRFLDHKIKEPYLIFSSKSDV